MSSISKEYDIILYGANGYTASFIIPYLENHPLKIGLAARSPILYKTDLVKIQCSQVEASSLTRILINCVGPYHLTGEEVILSCINNNTHYIDLCGEVHFLKYIQEKYKDCDINIVQACGFDSVISDLGVEYLKSCFDRDVEIESVMELNNCVINRGTWNSLIDSLSAYKKPVKSIGSGKKEWKYDSDLKSYIVKFRGSDYFVVKTTQSKCNQYNSNHSNINHSNSNHSNINVQYSPYLKIGSLINLMLYFFYSFLINFLSPNICKKYYRILSYFFVVDKPNREIVKKGSFKLLFRGLGMKNTEYIRKDLVVEGPDPGYTTTGICISQAALLLLDSKSKGVGTPGSVFGEELRKKLEVYGISFTLK